MNKILLFICGFVLLAFGMTLIFRHWDAMQIVFKGVMPAAMAVGGLVLMFAASLKK